MEEFDDLELSEPEGYDDASPYGQSDEAFQK